MQTVRRKIRDVMDARVCLKEVAATGQSVGEWSRMHGVDGRSLNHWKQSLARSECPSGSSAGWVELVAKDATPATRYVVRSGLFAVEVDAQFEDGLLRRLLAVVSSC